MGGAFEGFDHGASKTENPVANFCAPGYISVTEDGGMTYTVHPLEDVAVAEANGEYYVTLAEAVETVVSSSGKMCIRDRCGNIYLALRNSAFHLARVVELVDSLASGCLLYTSSRARRPGIPLRSPGPQRGRSAPGRRPPAPAPPRSAWRRTVAPGWSPSPAASGWSPCARSRSCLLYTSTPPITKK